MNTTNFLLILLGSCLILCFILMLIQNSDYTYTTKNLNRSIEGFAPTASSNTIQDPVINAIQSQLEIESPEALKSTVQALQQRLIDYGYAPDLNTFVKKTELGPNDGKCLVNKAEDRDKYISKSDIPPPGPRIDLSQYVKKSSIPPEKVCPPPPEIDYSAYVKKSTLPPNEKCAPCIAPKVKVSAGLCRECPPAPSCPPPERCPEKKCPEAAPCPAEKKCPEPAPCPAEKKCPEPAPCPTIAKCKSCDEIRYIKVPSVITKTVMVDENGNIISQKIDSGVTNPTNPTNTTNTPSTTQCYRAEKKHQKKHTTTTSALLPTTTQVSLLPTLPQVTQAPQTTSSNSIFNIFGLSQNQIPTTTFPEIHTCNKVFGSKKALCPACDLNSEFKSYGIYGPE